MVVVAIGKFNGADASPPSMCPGETAWAENIFMAARVVIFVSIIV